MKSDYEKLESTIGYAFGNRELLQRALRHSSFVNEHREDTPGDNERLEFLGDAVLELVSSEYIYENYPQMPEGDMTKLRASLVCEPTLALCAKDLSLPDYILLGRGEEMTGGRKRASIISDAMEALIGAIFLDGGLDPAREFVLKFILTDIDHKKLFYDSKTILQELIQKLPGQSVTYVLSGEEGPDHAKTYYSQVHLGDRVLGEGSGPTKKASEMEAAYRAILFLKRQGTCI